MQCTRWDWSSDGFCFSRNVQTSYKTSSNKASEQAFCRSSGRQKQKCHISEEDCSITEKYEVWCSYSRSLVSMVWTSYETTAPGTRAPVSVVCSTASSSSSSSSTQNTNKFLTRPTCQFGIESGALRWRRKQLQVARLKPFSFKPVLKCQKRISWTGVDTKGVPDCSRGCTKRSSSSSSSSS